MSRAPTPASDTARAADQRPALLRTGETVAIRAVTTGDEPELSRFLDGLCLEARRLRFFTGAVDLGRMAHRVAGTGPDRIGLLALDAHEKVVGHALCIELDEARAEVAVEVADRLHGAGLGTILVERLAQLAQERGIVTFLADVLPENRAMLDVFRDGFDAHVAFAGGVDRVEFPTAAWRLARERFPEAREGEEARGREESEERARADGSSPG